MPWASLLSAAAYGMQSGLIKLQKRSAMVPREGAKVTKGKRPDDICPLMENLSQSESSIGETFIRGTLSKQQMGVHSMALPIIYRDGLKGGPVWLSNNQAG